MCPPQVALTSDNRLRYCHAARSTERLDQSAPSRFAGLLLGAQRLDCDDDGKQPVGVLPISDGLLSLSLGYSAATFLVSQILAHDFIFTSTTSAMTSHKILITAKY